MIDNEVRQVIEVELTEGESLLWAEKTCHQTQELHKNWFQLTAKKRQALIVLLILSLSGLLIGFSIPAGINKWGTASQIFLYNIFFHLCLYAFLAAAVLLFLNFLVKGRVYNIGAYGLTDKRLFELDYDFEIIRYLDASRVKTVYGSEGVSIKPIGAKGIRAYQLGLMNNSTLTINYIHTQLRRIGRVI